MNKAGCQALISTRTNVYFSTHALQAGIYTLCTSTLKVQLYFCQSHLAVVTVCNSCTGVTVIALPSAVRSWYPTGHHEICEPRAFPEGTSSHRQFWEKLNKIQGKTNEIRTQIGVDSVGHASSRINDEFEVKPNMDGLHYVRKLHKFIDFIADDAL